MNLLIQTIQNTNVIPDELSGLQPIKIQIFPQLSFGFDPTYATLFSWIAFLGSLITIGIIVIFVARIIIASYKAISSDGDKDKLGNAYQRIQANLIGAGVSLSIPIILSFIGLVLGFGNIFQWPKMFSSCNAEGYQFYVEAYLREGDRAEQICFN